MGGSGLRIGSAVRVGMAIGLLAASSGRAATFTFSDASSDTTPAAWLAATLEYTMLDPATLELSVRNDTSSAAPFDIMLIFFNALPAVEYLTLTSAVSSREGENLDAWRLGYYGYDRITAGFGEFDYSLRTEPGGHASDRIAPGETQRFTLSAYCVGYAGCLGGLIGGMSEGGRMSASLALRFAYGPNGDAGFGAHLSAVPEPHGAALLGLGLAALAGARHQVSEAGAPRPGARGRLARRSPRAA
jgi:hypothetical protein